MGLDKINYPRLNSLLLVPAAKRLGISCGRCKDHCGSRRTSPNCCAGCLAGCGIGARMATAPHANIAHFAFPRKGDRVLLGLNRKLAGRSNTVLHQIGTRRVRKIGLLNAFYCGPRTMFPVCFIVHIGGLPSRAKC